MKKIKDLELNEIKPSKVKEESYECNICNDRGWVRTSKEDGYLEDYDFIEDKTYYLKECECRLKRKFQNELIEMGLEPILDKILNIEYKIKFDWQQDAYNRAKSFIKSDTKGLIISGQTGCGKTLLFGKMVYNFVSLGKTVMYFDWHNNYEGQLVDRYKVVNEDLMREMLEVEVLYIDDLLKAKNNDLNLLAKKTQEIMVARKIIDRRATMPSKKTMISMELFSEDIEKIEPSLNGRLIEMVGTFENWIHMDRKENRNIRLLQAKGEF